jgi:hypothetical protein
MSVDRIDVMGYEYFIYEVYARNFECIFLAFAYLWPLWCVCSIDVVVS